MDRDLYRLAVSNVRLYPGTGKIIESVGLLCEAALPGSVLGSGCSVEVMDHQKDTTWVEGEVVGFRGDRALVMTYEETRGIRKGSRVQLTAPRAVMQVGDHLLGRVLDGLGQPMDRIPLEPTREAREVSLFLKPSHPLERALVTEPLDLGVRAINGLLTVGRGQRIGIMAGSGVGKSVLLGMLARHSQADINVIALIGERGREVREFIEKDLGPEGLQKSVLIVATSDTSALLRMRAAYAATAVAEYFRDAGKQVLLLMDSVTRFSMSAREIGLAMGEPPASKGYTPSVFAQLPKLLERAGTSQGSGSITGIYTVLVEGDDLEDPIADTTRSILDGHIVLDRRLAEKNHFPAIDVLRSTSRVMRAVTESGHQEAAGKVRELLASYRDADELIQIGAYVRGSSKKTDEAIAKKDRMDALLKQRPDEKGSFTETLDMLASIAHGPY